MSLFLWTMGWQQSVTDPMSWNNLLIFQVNDGGAGEKEERHLQENTSGKRAAFAGEKQIWHDVMSKISYPESFLNKR